MTQQGGQGAASSDPQPADRHAHEGIVLPADGSEPLMPGTTGDQVAPAGGSPWGQPWGPAPADPPPGSGQAWGAPEGAAPGQGQGQGSQGRQTYGAGTPLPPEGTPQPPQYGTQPQAPQYGAQPSQYGTQPPQHGAPSPHQYGAQPPADASYGGQYGAQYGGPPAGGAHARPSAGGAHAAPPAAAGYPAQSAQPPGQLPPVAQAGQLPPAVGGMPLPQAGAAAGDADATQYIPPVPAGPQPPYEAQPQPQRHAAPDEGATQYIPPVAPGALPPEAPAGEATQFLGRAPMPPVAGSDSEPTQYIAPVPPLPAEPGAAPFGIRPGAPGDRQPPAEFDSLFRTEQPEEEGPASTQQMPRFEPPQPAAAHAGHGAHGAHGAHGGDGGGRAARRAAADTSGGHGGRTGSKVPLFAAIGVAIALLGVGAGALLSGGGDDEKKDSPQTVSESAPADDKPSPSADPAKEQAVALDKLLADSNNSRDSVIAAVRNVGRCADLGKSATDLRNAAKQRNGLVTRLSALSVDKLPSNVQLTASLTKAWKASAAADNHYAAWAGQVAGKKGCKKGHARVTPQAAAANKSSGEATTAKQEAAGLWNPIAQEYELTTRDKSQL